MPARRTPIPSTSLPGWRRENLAVRALAQMAPWILLVLLIFSLLCALVYSRYITRPIVRLSGIAGKMAQLDFQWESGEKRRDEIGRLGRSLDQMAQIVRRPHRPGGGQPGPAGGGGAGSGSWTGSGWPSSTPPPTS